MTMMFSIVYAGTAYGLSYLFGQTGSYRLLFVIAAVALLIGCVLDLASSRQAAR